MNTPVRHLVLCGFKPEATPTQIAAYSEHFRSLATLIPGVLAFECGANNSPEGLNRGLTHAFQLTFESAQARDTYLPHPEHKRFIAEKGDILAQVLVLDYVPQ